MSVSNTSMQEGQQSNSLGVVRWVDPSSRRHHRDKKNLRFRSGKNNLDNTQQPASQSENDPSYSQPEARHRESESDGSKPVIDLPTCRTICTFVEEHLRELKERQGNIDKARAKLQENGQIQVPDANLLAHNNVSKIRIRDEQTKAIDTIKRLTSYLKELTFVEKSYNQENNANPIEDIVANKLSDIRNEIIQALNDFVLSNSDIDVPIAYPDELKCIDTYDLCIDAMTSTKDLCRSYTAASSSKFNRDSFGSDGNCDDIGDESGTSPVLVSTDLHIENLAKRKREVAKLEKDTEELRRLFSDFYDLIKTQGEQLDSIEDNIVIASQRINEGHHHLSKTMKGLTILMPVTGCMAGALIGGPLGLVVGGKLGGLTLGCASSLLGLLSSYSLQRCVSPGRINSH